MNLLVIFAWMQFTFSGFKNKTQGFPTHTTHPYFFYSMVIRKNFWKTSNDYVLGTTFVVYLRLEQATPKNWILSAKDYKKRNFGNHHLEYLFILRWRKTNKRIGNEYGNNQWEITDMFWIWKLNWIYSFPKKYEGIWNMNF